MSASHAETASAAEHTPAGHAAGPGLTVLYDADCGVCRLTILALQQLDWHGRLDPVPLQWFTGEQPTREELLATLHVRDRFGRWALGGDATLRIAAAVPLLLPLAILGRLPGARPVAEAAYRLLAGQRGTLSRLLRLDACAPHLRGGSAAARSQVVNRQPGSR